MSKKINIKLQKIYELIPYFNMIFSKNCSNSNTIIKVMELTDIINDATYKYEVMKNALIQTYADKDETTGNIKTFVNESTGIEEPTFSKENRIKYDQDIHKLLIEDIELEFKPLIIEDIKNLEFSAEILKMLLPFCELTE